MQIAHPAGIAYINIVLSQLAQVFSTCAFLPYSVAGIFYLRLLSFGGLVTVSINNKFAIYTDY